MMSSPSYAAEGEACGNHYDMPSGLDNNVLYPWWLKPTISSSGALLIKLCPPVDDFIDFY